MIQIHTTRIELFVAYCIKKEIELKTTNYTIQIFAIFTVELVVDLVN